MRLKVGLDGSDPNLLRTSVVCPSVISPVCDRVSRQVPGTGLDQVSVVALHYLGRTLTHQRSFRKVLHFVRSFLTHRRVREGPTLGRVPWNKNNPTSTDPVIRTFYVTPKTVSTPCHTDTSFGVTTVVL